MEYIERSLLKFHLILISNLVENNKNKTNDKVATQAGFASTLFTLSTSYWTKDLINVAKN